MNKLLLLADDLTGALDTAAHFAESGIKAEVLFRHPNKERINLQDLEGHPVVIIDTETRHTSEDIAYKIITNILNDTRKLNFTHYFKKTDSALRGNIGAELKALADFSKSDVKFIPAYPKMNRITKDGFHYIDGKLVTESIFAKDPFTPVKHSFIPQLLDVATSTLFTDKTLNRDVVIYDAVSDQDIFDILFDLKQDDSLNILAGCAALAEELPEYIEFEKNLDIQLKPAAKTIIYSGSLNGITHSQLEYLEKNDVEHFILSDEAKKDINYIESKEGLKLLKKINKEVEKNHNVAISVGSEEISKQDQISLRENVGQRLGRIAYEIIDQNKDANIFIIGGDTVVSLMYELDNPKIMPIKLLSDGVVLSELKYSDNKLNLITKSGGFGKEDVLIEVMRKLKTKK